MYVEGLRLPVPPSVNRYYVRSRRGVCVGKEGKSYRAMVRDTLTWGGVEPLRCPVGVLIDVFHDRIDLDNILKCLLDALQGGLYLNDKQIDDLRVRRRAREDGVRPHVVVNVWPLETMDEQDHVS